MIMRAWMQARSTCCFQILPFLQNRSHRIASQGLSYSPSLLLKSPSIPLTNSRVAYITTRGSPIAGLGNTNAAAADDSGSVVCNIKTSILDVPGPLAEELCDLLLAEGATSASVEEFREEGAPEQKIFAHDSGSDTSDPTTNSNSGTSPWTSAGGAPRVWDRCTIVGYFPIDIDASSVATDAATALGLGQLAIQTEQVKMQDWEGAIRDSYQPVEVAPGLWIVPTWAQPVDLSATNLILEPGLAFGTGDHPTTRLCLRWLRSLQASSALLGAAVMDYGTGSGVLATAALVMGASKAVGTDVEPLAVKAAAQNAEINGVGDKFVALRCAAELSAPEPMEAAGILGSEERLFDVVVANILKGPLVELAPRLAFYARPGASLGLSGILVTQVPAVLEAYDTFFRDFKVDEEEGWALVTAIRK